MLFCFPNWRLTMSGKTIASFKDYQMVKSGRDASVVNEVIDLNMDIDKWLNDESLTVEQLEGINSAIEKYKRAPMNDTSLRAYSVFIPQMVEIEDCWGVCESRFFLSLFNYVKVSFFIQF